MKKYLVFTCCLAFVTLGLAREAQNVQLAVQNEVMSPVNLHCMTRSDVAVQSGLGADGSLQIESGGSAAIEFTFNHFSKNKPLIRCVSAQNQAGFAYFVLSEDKETMKITASSDSYNFYYDPAYTGSVVYR